MPSSRSALQAIRMFKDEYLLDFINVEGIDETYGTVDERIVENPWPGQTILVRHSDGRTEKLQGDFVEFPTQKNEKLRITKSL